MPSSWLVPVLEGQYSMLSEQASETADGRER